MLSLVSPSIETWESGDGNLTVPSEAIENSTVTFTCSCTAFPTPTIRWEIYAVQLAHKGDWIPDGRSESLQVTRADGCLQLNSTRALIARPELLGNLFRCICSSEHSDPASKTFQLLFQSMYMLFSYQHNISRQPK